MFRNLLYLLFLLFATKIILSKQVANDERQISASKNLKLDGKLKGLKKFMPNIF